MSLSIVNDVGRLSEVVSSQGGYDMSGTWVKSVPESLKERERPDVERLTLGAR